MSPPVPCQPMPDQAGLSVDEEEMRRWSARLIERGYRQSTVDEWVFRIRSAYRNGVADAAMVDEGCAKYATTTRSGIRQALRELEEFRRSA